MTAKDITDKLSSKLGKKMLNIWPHLKFVSPSWPCWAGYTALWQVDDKTFPKVKNVQATSLQFSVVVCFLATLMFL